MDLQSTAEKNEYFASLAEALGYSIFKCEASRRAVVAYLFSSPKRPDLRLSVIQRITSLNGKHALASSFTTNSPDATRDAKTSDNALIAALQASIASPGDVCSNSTAELIYTELASNVIGAPVELENYGYTVELHNIVMQIDEGPLDMALANYDCNLYGNNDRHDGRIPGDKPTYTLRWWRSITTEIPYTAIGTMFFQAAFKAFVSSELNQQFCNIRRPDMLPAAPKEGSSYRFIDIFRGFYDADAWMRTLFSFLAEGCVESAEQCVRAGGGPKTHQKRMLNTCSRIFRVVVSAFMFVITHNIERYGAARCMREPAIFACETVRWREDVRAERATRAPLVQDSAERRWPFVSKILNHLGQTASLTDADYEANAVSLYDDDDASLLEQRRDYWQSVLATTQRAQW
jgi:hypothetical protein